MQYKAVMNVYESILTRSNVLSTVSCNIQIGSLSGTLSNCTIRISNQCRNTSDSVELLKYAYDKVTGTPDPLALWTLQGSCVAIASLRQNIKIQEIDLGICSSQIPIEFTFINSGEAVSNCMTQAMMVSAYPVEATSNVEDDSTSTMMPLIYTSISVGISLILLHIWLSIKSRKLVRVTHPVGYLN